MVVETPSGFRIRQATEADAESIANAHRDSIQTIGSQFYTAEVVQAWAAAVHPSMYVTAMAKGEVFFIAIDGARVLGFSSHHVVGGQHRTAVYVRGSHARQGIGTALFRLAEDSARRGSAENLHVDASLAAVNFYKRNGFEELGRGEHSLTSGHAMACVFMRKILAAGIG